MKIEAFGRSYCPYCQRIKQIVEDLKSKGHDAQYFDMDSIGISKEDLSQRAGKPCNTIPQVWIDDKHIGGHDDTVAFLAKNK